MGSGLLAGCVYNTLYNAEALYREAEDLRLAGQDSALSERYREVVAKATKGYESNEDGGRADDALLLMAKAQIRLGAIAEAKQTLERVLEISDDPDLRRQAALYRGVAAVAAGEMMRGIELLDEAIAAAAKNSMAKSRADTASKEFAIGRAKPRSRAVATRSIG